MDTKDTKDTGTKGHRLSRILTTAALACFALPFLTVSCYGDATVSGVQAATKIDLYPNDGAGEAELLREEPPNGFAFVALVAAVVGVAASFGAARSRRAGVWAAAVGVVALHGLFLYAFYRSWGDGMAPHRVHGRARCSWWRPRGPAPGGSRDGSAGRARVVAASMIPATVIGPDVAPEYVWLTIPVYVGGFIAVALVVGAVGASARAAELASADPASRPSTPRMVLAGIAGIVVHRGHGRRGHAPDVRDAVGRVRPRGRRRELHVRDRGALGQHRVEHPGVGRRSSDRPSPPSSDRSRRCRAEVGA